MALNTSITDKVLARRQAVSRYRLRGWTQREIAVELCVSAATVNRDIASLEDEWRTSAARDIADHKMRVLAELSEVKRAAWAEKNYSAILQATKLEVGLLGLDAPIKIEADLDVNVSDAREQLARKFDRFAAPGKTPRAAGLTQ